VREKIKANDQGIRVRRIFLIVCLMIWAGASYAVDRFPRPQFETAYEMPQTMVPSSQRGGLEWADVVLLAAALAVSSLIALKVRHRRVMLIFTVICLAYFGFWRMGCICPVGSLQNVSAAAGDAAFPVSLPVLFFFILPLLTALIAGRTFCASVCPLGAIQDLVVFKPVRIQLWLVAVLEMFAGIYLGLAITVAAAGGGFLICRYDPFVGLFRLSGPWQMITAGVLMLALGLFIARPYCRFICPYGVLLRFASLLSWKHLTIAPEKCVDCKLCANSCPFGAIQTPTPARADEVRAFAVRRMGLSLMLIPFLIAGGYFVGRALAPRAALLHPTVALDEQVKLTQTKPDTANTLEVDAFRLTGTSAADLSANAAVIRRKMAKGLALAGGAVGGVFAWQIFLLALRRKRRDYTPDRGRCLSCVRCVEYCPEEQMLRKRLK